MRALATVPTWQGISTCTCRLCLTGATAEAMGEWISEGIAKDREGALERIVRFNPHAEAVLAAEGSECERCCCLAEGTAVWANGCW